MIRVEKSRHYKLVEQEPSASEETAWWLQCLWTYETPGCGSTTKKTKIYIYCSWHQQHSLIAGDWKSEIRLYHLWSCLCSSSSLFSTSLHWRWVILCEKPIDEDEGGGQDILWLGTCWYRCPWLSPQKLKMLETPEKKTWFYILVLKPRNINTQHVKLLDVIQCHTLKNMFWYPFKWVKNYAST